MNKRQRKKHLFARGKWRGGLARFYRRYSYSSVDYTQGPYKNILITDLAGDSP